MEQQIIITGARQHNLKNVSLRIPKNSLVVFTGVSGSGKSSLAFDTIYAEGQRRYVESLSSYARQFLGIMDKPDVDNIEGLSPAISIDQKSTSHNPRSTVGTVTEIYDYLRLLYARIGHPHCPNCGREISKLSASQIVQLLLDELTREVKSQKIVRFFILSPVVSDRKGEFSGLLDNIRKKGYRMVRIDGHILGVDDDILLLKSNKHTIEVVVDRFTVDKTVLAKDSVSNGKSMYDETKSRLTDSVEQALKLSQSLLTVSRVHDSGFTFPERPKEMSDSLYSERFACPICGISISEIEPRSFSFNSPHGACEKCTGLGTILTVDPQLVFSPDLTISEGGILPFAKMFFHDTWYSRIVARVIEENEINPKIPLKDLPLAHRQILLEGTGDRLYTVKGTNRQGVVTSIDEPFSGIIAELKRRHNGSESDFVRSEIEKYMRQEVCLECMGSRLKKEALTVTIDNKSIAEVSSLSIVACFNWMNVVINDSENFSKNEKTIAKPIIKEIIARLGFLKSVGLEYLTVSRTATTLAGGEAQRIRLASQIGSGLSGVLYVLDEPSIGLHSRDNAKLIETLVKLRDLGNTVLVVEHDREMMQTADYLVDFGPLAGKHGGTIVAEGTYNEVLANPKSITAKYLSGKKVIYRKKDATLDPQKGTVTIRGAGENNLKNIDVTLPLGKFVCVTGVSGSGKSTLIVETLYEAIHHHFNPFSKTKPGKFEKIEGLENLDKVVLIDQSPIGRTPRSNPATYTGIFTYIRDLFAELPDSRKRGFTPGRFSFNVKGGRCEACEGEGQKKIEMQFLSDVYITCEVCGGLRYNAETLEMRYKDKSIAEVLGMTIEESLAFFESHPIVREKLQILNDVGLSYMHLGQSATTLSGGEAQRVKLGSELMRRATGKTLYILDEPTTGLHFQDLENLLHVLDILVKNGNTVVVIEHNTDIIKNADWIIDLGPEGGDFGGSVVVEGSVEKVKNCEQSYTGKYL